MRVYIGPYLDRWRSTIHDKWLDYKYGEKWWTMKDEEYTKFDNFVEKVENTLQTVYNKTINKVLDKRERKIKVRVDKYDIWGADHTIAIIVHPLLLKLKETKNGAPLVDDEDVPEELRSTAAPPKENEWDTDGNHFKRWDWVLDEMIWTFEQKSRADWKGDYYKYEYDPSATFVVKLVWEDREGRKAHQARMNNGFRLFGKYFEGLWY